LQLPYPHTNIFSPTAKFSGYQYGGRPLGITFVKYMNAGPAPEEMMEGQESAVGLTQDQIM
jgi:hypothetical protein